VFTFVNAHLTAHAYNLRQRINDWNHISTCLLFPSFANPNEATTIYASSHLFFLGDLNFRLDIPTTHPLRSDLVRLNHRLSTAEGRAELKEYDQLLIELRKGTIFQGMSEAEFWQFKCSYKFKLGTVDQYSKKRAPAWTDRILYATYTDSPDASKVIPLLYTSVPSYTTSDHKPIVALLLIPPPASPDNTAAVPIDASTSVPLLPHLSQFKPDPYANLKRNIGKVIGRIIGLIWYVIVFLGFGHAALGISNVIVGWGALAWWRKRNVDAV